MDVSLTTPFDLIKIWAINVMFKIIDKHPVIFVLITVSLIMTLLNYAAGFFLEKPAEHALIQQAMRDQKAVLENIYGKGMAKDYKIVLREQGLGQRYYPFVEYLEKPRKGKFVNVSEQGARCHYPDRESCTAKGGRQEIWIFGGSTTFGYGVKDSETIAANLGRMLPDFRIINFGAGGYYSTIERIRFENLLTEFPPPRAAIFIDGINDFYFFNVPDKSIFTNAYSHILNREKQSDSLVNDIRARLEGLTIYRLFVQKFGHSIKVVATSANHEQILKAIHRLSLNHSIIESIGDKLGITILNVIQPIPLYGVGHKTSHVPKERLNFGDHKNSGVAYQVMFGPNGDFSHPNSRTLNLANLGIDEGMYVDTVHYTPLFNEKIASEIHQKISVKFATNND